MRRDRDPGTFPALWSGLFDDAAVYPPAYVPLHDAVAAYRAHRQAWYAPLVGPLLVPPSRCVELFRLADPHDAPLRVGLTIRPGIHPELLGMAAAGLAATKRVGVSIVELGWHPEWREVGLDVAAVPTALEVPRGPAQSTALADIRRARDEGARVGAKFRTGTTPNWAWPDEAELADFLLDVVQRRLPFKLTGGLHHAVRGRYTTLGEEGENHGLLNVVLAIAAALAEANESVVTSVLEDRDTERLVARVEARSDDQVASIRDRFVAYAVCAVTDPINELNSLGLLD